MWNFSNSDHNAVRFKFIMDEEKDGLGLGEISQHLAKADWQQLFVGKSIADQWREHSKRSW